MTEISFNGAGEVHGEGGSIWMPDDTIYDATTYELLMAGVLANVYSGGSVWVSLPIKTVVPCPMKLRRFPFDTQSCTLTHGSWTLNGHYQGHKRVLQCHFNSSL